jgi:glutamine amidotransferase
VSGSATPRVAIVDAGGANFASVRCALERVGARVALARDADGLRGAERIVLPGVGAAAPAMALLRERGFEHTLRSASVPLLGICLGMQLLFAASAEGEVATLGVLQGRVDALPPAPGVRVPHMGWNVVSPTRPSPLFDGIAAGTRMYFVHGFGAAPGEDCVAETVHGAPFAAAVQRGNVLGVQFHPERSAAAGARLLANFLRMAAA